MTPDEKRRDVIVLFTNGAAMIRVAKNDGSAWASAREFAVRGIEDRERGFIIPPTMIQEIQVRPHDPNRRDAASGWAHYYPRFRGGQLSEPEVSHSVEAGTIQKGRRRTRRSTPPI